MRDQTENYLSYEFGEFRLEPSNHRLLKSGQPVTLTPKALQTLQILVENAGNAVSKDQLFEMIWSDSVVEEANLTQYIYLLRRTLGESYIETVARFGYRFIVDVKKICPVEDTTKTEEIESEQSRIETTEMRSADSALEDVGSVKFDQFRTKRRILAVTAMIIFAVAGLGLLAFVRFGSISNISNQQNSVSSMAVLPFRTIGEEAANQKLGLGMADAVIVRLSKLNQIPVRPTSAVFRFAEADTDAVSVGRQLQVDAIMEGTVQREGNRIRVSVQLLRVETGETLFAEKFDGEFSNIFNVQDTISANVADSLALSLAGKNRSESVKSGTSNPDAYAAYVLGIYFWNRRNEENLKKAERYFQKAVELDPNYAKAYAGLADTYNLLSFNRYVSPAEIGPKAKAAAYKAVELDPNIAEAHIALAQVQFAFDNDADAGIASLEKAIAISPYNPTAHLRYGWALLNALRIEDTEREMRLAREYDPISPIYNLALCNVLVFRRKYDEAAINCERALELDPNVPDGRVSLSTVYLLQNRNLEALNIISEEVSLHPDDLYAQASKAYIYARSGKTQEAEQITASLLTHTEKIPTFVLEIILTDLAVEKNQAALNMFEKTLKSGGISRAVLEYDPRLDDLRADPDFAALIARQMDFSN